MAHVASNGIRIEYERFGDPDAPPFVLISGWAAQMLFWNEGFCRELAGRGFLVIRFDNRDTGLSTKRDDLGVPDVRAVRAGRQRPAYTLDDMAVDVVGLLDALDLSAAHVAGVSIGGYIAQVMALNHPDRVLSLASMMSGLSGDDLVEPTDWDGPGHDAMPTDEDARIEHRVDEIAAMASPQYFDRDRVRREVVRAMARSRCPDGAERQASAVWAATSRATTLARLAMPVMVLHGALDKALPVENAYRTAAAAPGSKLVVIPDLNHDLPPQLWVQIVDHLVTNAQRADVTAH
ncbi:alpha/beta hydrolase [soil metagenome]